MTEQAPAAPRPRGTDVHGHRHPSPAVLAATLGALVLLTGATVAATWIDFGPVINLWIALAIATLKGTLVALYFMHLRYDRPFNAIVLLCALLFVMLFISLALMDSQAYRPDVQEFRSQDPARYAPRLEGR